MDNSKDCKNNSKEEIHSQRQGIPNKNIVLIGMPGSGKSTIAKAINDITNMPILETDLEIEIKEGACIPKIFETKGETYFRKVEKLVCKQVGKTSGQIVSTGGGVVLDEQNMKYLKENGRIYYVKRNIENLATSGRPLSVGGLAKLKKMYEDRKYLYERYCDCEIYNNDVNLVAIKILEDYNAYHAH